MDNKKGAQKNKWQPTCGGCLFYDDGRNHCWAHESGKTTVFSGTPACEDYEEDRL